MDRKIPLAFQEIILQISLLGYPTQTASTENLGPYAVTFHSQKRVTWHLYFCCFFHYRRSFNRQQGHSPQGTNSRVGFSLWKTMRRIVLKLSDHEEHADEP